MPVPFSHTTRSLAADSFIPGGVVLGLGALLIALWVAWLGLGTVVLREVASSAVIGVQGPARRVFAVFPAPCALRLRPGMSARIRVHGAPAGSERTALAGVRRVDDALREGQLHAELELQDGAGQRLPAGFPVEVEVEVETVAPGARLLQEWGS